MACPCSRGTVSFNWAGHSDVPRVVHRDATRCGNHAPDEQQMGVMLTLRANHQAAFAWYQRSLRQSTAVVFGRALKRVRNHRIARIIRVHIAARNMRQRQGAALKQRIRINHPYVIGGTDAGN